MSTRRAAAARPRADCLLPALAAATVAAYAVFWLRPLWLGDFKPFAGEAFGLTVALGGDWAGAARYVAGALVLLALYGAALVALPRCSPSLAWRLAVGVAVLAPVAVLFTYPVLAADVFDYLMSGRLISAHHLNPYTWTAASAPQDPYYPPVGWKDQPSIYGPLWVDLMAAVTYVAGGATTAALLLAKALSVLAHLGAAVFVYLIARKVSPGRQLAAFVAYAWNPLVIIYVAVDGHNDSVLLLSVLAAVYFGLDRRWEAALPALTLGTLVKFVPAALFPLFLWQARRDARPAAVGGLVSIVLAVALFAPLWAGDATFDGLRDQAARMTSSPVALASFYAPDAWLRPVAGVVFAAGYVVILARGRSLVWSCYAVLLLYLVVLSWWTKPWYFIWPIGLAAVLGGDALWITLPGIVGLFASNLVGAWGWQMDWLHWQARWGSKMMEAWLTATTVGGWLLGLGALGGARLLWPRFVPARRRAAPPAREAQGPAKTTA